jgi:protein phosphatase
MLRAAETIKKTDTGRQRRDNEDSAYARPPVFVVADGMGGAQAGEVASKIAVEAFEQGLPSDGKPEDRLATRVREANQRIHDLSQEQHERAGMGTTITAAYLDEDDVVIAHVGDSRAYLFRDGELRRLTQDHTLVAALVDQGKLTEEEAAEHPQRSIITRALGPEASVDVDTWTYPLRDGDVLLLCSDGLTSMVSEELVGEVLRSAPSLEAAGQTLIDEANNAGGRDNITVVLVRLEEVSGAHAATDQPTVVRSSGTEERESAATKVPLPPPAPVPPPAPPPAAPEKRRRARLARTQGPPPPPGTGRPRRRFTKPAAAGLATLIVLFLIGAGGWLASRQLYFVGTNPQGVVTIYRGLPYDLPGGIRLYEKFYVSGVPAGAVPADRRSKLLDHHLRSQRDAISLVRDLELGRVAK